MAFDGRASIVEIDEEEKTVIFDIYRFKKITGTKVGPILGDRKSTRLNSSH